MVNQEKKAPIQNISRVVSLEELGYTAENPVLADAAFSDYVRALMQNTRQGTVATKTRGEVAFANKKPWKQKGTGRARAGSRRSPLWRKGGVTFGPQARVRTLKVSPATKRKALAALLRQGVEQGRIISLNWALDADRPKTALAYQALRDAGLHDKRVVLFIGRDDYQTQASFNNLSDVYMLLFDQPNAYALASGDYWVFLSKDTEAFKNMVGAWI